MATNARIRITVKQGSRKKEGVVNYRHLLSFCGFPIETKRMFCYPYIVNQTSVRDRIKGDFMRHKDPELMKKIATFVEEFYGIRNRMPSVTDLFQCRISDLVSCPNSALPVVQA